ncbi:MAG: hypothetical protein GC154_19825 [bacterium]|nr:hypothetical protein [bacterium]
MPLFSVNLKVAAEDERASRMKVEVSPTLCDGYEPLPGALSLPIDELRVATFDDVFRLMGSEEELGARRLFLDLRGFTEQELSRLIVYLAPVLYRWTGEDFVVVLPDQVDAKDYLPPFADLLRSLELRSRGIRIISCPTCARCRTDFPEMVRSIEDRLEQMETPLDVAVMGCEVNGPGEARAADIGIAFGDQKGMLFKKGEKVRVVTIEEAADVLLAEIDVMAKEAAQAAQEAASEA